MGLTITADSAVSSTGSRATKYWTRTTLATELMGELPSSCRQSGGAAPTRLVNIVLQSMGDLEETHDWRWRRASGTASLTSAAATFRISNSYTDFGKLLNTVLIETSGYGTIKMTQDVERFRLHQLEWLDRTGQPELGILEVDTALSEHGMLLRVSPTPNGTYAYSCDYLKTPAAYSTTDIPRWPPFMFRLWHLDCTWRGLYALDRKAGTWKDAKGLFEAELEKATTQNDEPEQSQLPRIHDGYGDAAAFASSGPSTFAWW